MKVYIGGYYHIFKGIAHANYRSRQAKRYSHATNTYQVEGIYIGGMIQRIPLPNDPPVVYIWESLDLNDLLISHLAWKWEKNIIVIYMFFIQYIYIVEVDSTLMEKY